MTDTVNVPREPTREMVDAGEWAWRRSTNGTGVTDAYRAMLAAAPKAEPVSDPYKFEDEVKWLRGAARYFSSRDTVGEDRAYWANVYNAEKANKIADRLAELMNAHPAPASDELLEAAKFAAEAIEAEIEELQNSDNPSWTGLHNALVTLDEAIAKHKGPQS